MLLWLNYRRQHQNRGRPHQEMRFPVALQGDGQKLFEP